MDDLETPYDTEIDFIECKVCNKSVRGESLYKIHLTTPTHVKKKEFRMCGGGSQYMRKFKDILEYLDYLKLDEPIIGLECLKELPSDNWLSGPNYTCTLCSATTNMSEMVQHVIGRKHRQKYVESKRKDLVTWDSQQFSIKGGKVIRAKAEIIERQDGRGFPKTSIEVFGKSNNKKAQPSVAPNKNKLIPQRPELVPPLLPEFRNYNKKALDQRFDVGFQNPPVFHPDEEAMDRRRQLDRNGPFGFDHREDGPYRAENMGSQVFREGDINSYPHGSHDEPFAKDPMRGAPFGSNFLPRPEYREEMPHDRNDELPFYQDRNPFKEPFPERQAPGEFFHEGHRGQVRRPEYEPTQMYSKGENWSRERDPSDYDHMNRSPRRDMSEPELKRRILSSSIDGGDHFCSIIKDYRHQKQRPHQEEPRKEVEATQTISDIPEPFKQFLSLASNDNPVKRKRVSRFTDASAEEVKMTNEMISGRHGSLHGNLDFDQRRANVPLRPETQVPPYSEQYRESQNLKYTESHQREAPDTKSVFDMLQNVEINSAEEAELLKSKLCSLLRDFKTKGNEKTESPNQEYDLKTYGYPKQEPQQLRQQYERTMRMSSNPGPQDAFFEDRGRALNQRRHTPEGMQQDFPHFSRGEPRHTNRSSYEALERAPPYRTERFQEPLRTREYKSPGEEPYDPFTMEEENFTPRGSRYSNSLEKITSTLLELVSRK